MGIRAEQFNVPSLLRFFVGRNELSRENIIKLLNNITNAEADELGLIGYSDLYSFKQNLYETIKEEIINGDIFNIFNNTDYGCYRADAYYYRTFLETYPLKYVLDLRKIKYGDFETSDSLFKKIQESNPKMFEVTVGTGTINDFKSILDFKPEYFYSDKDTIIRVALLELLDLRNIKTDRTAALSDLIDDIIGTNPVVSEFNHKNDSYLEGNSIYDLDYLSKYGFCYVLYLRDEYYSFNETIQKLGEYVANTNPVKEYVPEINSLPLKDNGYYTSEFLEKYGYITVLQNRGVKCSYDNTLEELQELIQNGNPEANDAYSHSILHSDRERITLAAYVNNFIKNKTISVDNKFYFKQGYANFIGKGLSVEIEHNTGLAPIACLIQQLAPSESDKFTGEIYTEMDTNKLYVYSEGENTCPFKWTLFFDKKNYMQFIKDSDYNDDYFKSTFGTIYLKRIQNSAVKLEYNEEYQKEIYTLDLSDYTEAISLNELLFINGVSYPLYGDANITFDLYERKIYFLDMVINPEDEIVLTCVAKDYYEDKDFANSVYVNEYSSFGEENFVGNGGTVRIRHFLKETPNFVIITPIERDKKRLDSKRGNIYYEADDEYIYVSNSGTAATKFRWFAFYSKDVKAIESSEIKNGIFKLTPSTLFYNINIPEITTADFGDIIYKDSELTHEVKISANGEDKDIHSFTLYTYDPNLRFVTSKKQFLEYTNGFTTNENGKFDNDPFSKPNGTAFLNYSGEFASSRVKSYSNHQSMSFEGVVYEPRDFEAGDVVSYDYESNCYVKSKLANAKSIVGVVVDKPAFTIGNYMTRAVNIAIAGIVDIKVRGAVEIGDLLSVSTLEGIAYAPKEFEIGTIVAKALEPFEPTTNSEIKIIKAIICLM